MKNRSVYRTFFAVIAIVLGLFSPSLALAEGAAVEAESTYTRSRKLGTTGMIMGCSGPVLTMIGMPFAGGFILTGMGSSLVGTSLLASSSLQGASAVRASGGAVGTGLGWVSVAGASTLLVSHVRWMPVIVDNHVTFMFIGVAGWGTSITTGVLQHRKNRTAWNALRTSQTRTESKRYTVQLAPTPTGAQVFGTF